MKYSQVKKRYFILLFFALVFSMHTYLHSNKEASEKKYLHEVANKQYQDYQIIYSKYKDISKMFFQTKINKPKIINFVKNRQRKELEEYLIGDYKKLRNFSIRQLHFHLPNNDSFLRMHRPSKFGDNLTKARLTVKYVNENLKPIDGFEEGKVFNGFRFVYPLFDNNEHIGSVEISFSALAFIKDIDTYYHKVSNFHIDKKVVDEKIFKDEKDNYVQSPLQQYYCQKSILEFIDIESKKRKFTKKQSEHLYKEIQKGDPFSKYSTDKDIITFMPIKHPITNKVTAVFTFRAKDMFITKNNTSRKIIFFSFIIVIAVLLLLLYQELRKREEIEEEIANKTEHIKELKERMELAFIGNNAGVYEWYMLDNSAYYSEQWMKMLGYKENELPAHLSTWKGRVHPDDIVAIMLNVKKSIKSKKRYIEIVHRLKHKNGEWLWVLGRGIIRYNKENIAYSMIGVHTNITKQKNLEIKYAQQAQIIEQIHDSVTSTNMEGVITKCNHGAEILLGYKSDEIIGQHVSKFYLDEDYNNIMKNFEILLKEGELHTEVRILQKSGKVIDIDLSLSLLKDENGTAIGMVGYSQDISSRKRAEKELAILNDTLESQVKEQVEKNKNQQLMMLHQSRLAQMGEMISMIAHQWRQPLNTLSVLTQTIALKHRRGKVTDEIMKNFDKDALKQMVLLIQYR